GGARRPVEGIVVEEDVHPHIGWEAVPPRPALRRGISEGSLAGPTLFRRQGSPLGCLKKRQPSRRGPLPLSRMPGKNTRFWWTDRRHAACYWSGQLRRTRSGTPRREHAEVVREEGNAAPETEAEGPGAPRGSADHA